MVDNGRTSEELRCFFGEAGQGRRASRSDRLTGVSLRVEAGGHEAARRWFGTGSADCGVEKWRSGEGEKYSSR
nr:hypothetical protein Iba_chr06dCG9350 [Ipomoea batatas]